MAETQAQDTDLDGDLNVAELGSGGDGDLAGAQAVSTGSHYLLLSSGCSPWLGFSLSRAKLGSCTHVQRLSTPSDFPCRSWSCCTAHS